MLTFLVLRTKPAKATKARPQARNQFDSGLYQSTDTGVRYAYSGVRVCICLLFYVIKQSEIIIIIVCIVIVIILIMYAINFIRFY